jgi:hypothetical protein
VDTTGAETFVNGGADDGPAEVLAAQGTDGQSNCQIRRFDPLTGKMVDRNFAQHPDFQGGGLLLG